MKKIFSLLLCLVMLLGSLPASWAEETTELSPSSVTDTVYNDSTLAGLTVESVVYQDGKENIISCGIYPAFSSTQTEGIIDVAYGAEEVRITAQPAGDKATLEINGIPASTGVATAVYGRDLAVGDNLIPIKVTAESGSQLTYTLHVKRVGGEYTLPQTPQAYQASGYAAYARRLASGELNLALKKDGTVIAWGNNAEGGCNVPAGLDSVTAVAASNRHSLALKQDGTVVAWGGRKGESNVPDGLSDVVDISAGQDFSAALTMNGRVVVWGQPTDYGQCDVPAGLNEAGDVVDIECGTRHMLALKADGTVVAWGWNGFGQCDVPVGMDHVVAIAAAHYYSMALKADGTLVIWGTDFNGKEFENLNLQYVKAIALGANHAVAFKWDDSLAVWGNDYYNKNEDLSVPLELDREILAISSGNDASLLALNEDGTVTVWGEGECDVPQGLNLFADDPPPYSGPAPNIPQTPAAYAASDYVQAAAKVISLGYAVLNMDGTVKVYDPKNYHGQADVPEGLNNVKSIKVTAYFIMALQQDGTVVFWGDNRDGACDLPEGLSNVKAIDAYSQYCLALKEDGTVVAWGGNYNGECDVPENLIGVKAIAAGSSHCLALKEDGTVAAWGNNDYGQCDVPAGLTDVARIFTGGDCSVVLRNDGTVVAWGNNDCGQRDVPPGLNNVVDICVNGAGCIALRGNGTVVVWGNNSCGNRNVPVGLHDVAAVCAGGLAVKADGTVVTWGDYTRYAEELAAETNVLTISDNTIIYRDGTLKYFSENTEYVEPVNQMLERLNVLSGHYFAVDKVELLDSSGQSITSVAGQGGYRINANIANNYCAPQDGLVIMQVRIGDGATAAGGGQVLECVGLAGEIPVDGKAVSIDFTMPDSLSGQAYVDVFVWDGWDTMVPRANPSQNLSFTVTEQ